MVNFSVLNELSLPLSDLSEFDEFFKVLSKLKYCGLEKIRMDIEFIQYPEILPNKTFREVLGQLSDRDKVRRLKSFVRNGVTVIESPLIRDDESESEQLLENEYFYDGNSTEGGLACCDIWNTVSVSFNSSCAWNSHYITLQKENIQSDDSINIEVRNISNKSHFSNHQDFFHELKEFIKSNITRENFFEKRGELFGQKIVICDEIEKQIRNTDTTIFDQALTILIDIEKGKSLESYTISKESDSVKQNASLKKLRMFKVDGEKEYFEKHIKNLSGGYRIHYFEKSNKIYIGYIGKHLPTKRFD